MTSVATYARRAGLDSGVRAVVQTEVSA